MDKIIIILIVFSFNMAIYSINLDYDAINTEFSETSNNSIFSFQIVNDEIYAFSKFSKTEENPWPRIKIIKFNGNEWVDLPNEFDNGSIQAHLITNGPISTGVTSDNKLVVAGAGIFIQNGTSWDWHFINDKYSEDREINQILVDKNDNIWFSTEIFINKNEMFSELYLLNTKTKQFKEIFQTNLYLSFKNMNKFYSTMNLIDGDKVGIYRSWDYSSTNDWPEGIDTLPNNYWVFDENGFVESKKIYTSTGEETKNFNLHLADYLKSSDESEYFSFAERFFIEQKDGNNYYVPCCGGLSKVKSDEWTLFNSDSGLLLKENPEGLPNSYEKIYNLIELRDGRILAFSNKNIYQIIGEELIKVNGEKFFENASVIYNTQRAFEFEGEFPLISHFKQFWEQVDEVFNNTKFEDIKETIDSKLWMNGEHGFFVVNVANITTNINENSFQSEMIYPNPTNNTLSIQTKTKYNFFKIYNQLGKVVANGNFKKEIDVNQLAQGLYYLELKNKTNKNVYKFIKN
jgi:hypothetical protein